LIHLVADGPGVVLDGSDPAFLQRDDWRDDGGDVFSLPFGTVTRLVCVDSLQRLYHHESVEALRAGAHGVAQGWVIEAGRLWVRLEDGSSPAGHTVHVARYHVGIYLEASYWRVTGFEIRHYGTVSGTGGGISLWSANGCVLTDNYVHAVGGHNIFLRGESSNALVERNLCADPRVSTWPWEAVKGHWEERSAVSNRAGRGNVIRHNTLTGTFDGIGATDGEADENVAADCDIHDNVIRSIGDDAIESDVVSGINLRIWRNRLEDVYVGISVAPIYQGPEYILFNTIVDYDRSGFKFSLSSEGPTMIYHNTVASFDAPCAAVHPSGPYSFVHFRNNILVGNDTPSVTDDAGESEVGNDFDGDLVHASGGTLFRWKNDNYPTLQALRQGTGFEMHGRSGDPLFTNPGGGDYTLQPESPAVDGGLRLPGINDVFIGGAPDMGAHEAEQETAVEVGFWTIRDEPDGLVLQWSVPRSLSGSTYTIWRADRDGDGEPASTPPADAQRLGSEPWGPREPGGREYEFRDAGAPVGVKVAYWVEDAVGDFAGPWEVERRLRPAAFTLRASGNPFSCSTRLFWTPCDGAPSLTVHDARGRLVVALGPEEIRARAEIGGQAWTWDGRDGAGREVPAGIYFASARAGDRRAPSLKLLRLR
jgi:hypothetical protein